MFHFFLSFMLAASRRYAWAVHNDPWGQEPSNPGPKKEQGPPDLEDFFKNLLNKKRQAPQDPNEPQAPRPSRNDFNLPHFNLSAIVLILAVGGILWLASGIYTVQERENGVETFLGKYQSSTRAGLNWNWPAPLGKVEKIDVTSISTMRIGELKTQKGSTSTKEQRTGQMLTSDENIVEIGATVQYRIKDARRYLFVANQPEKVLEDIIISAIREVVGANTVDDILRDRRNEWPEQAKQIMVSLLQQYDFGIEIVAFELQDARAPAEVQDAFEDAVRAREDEERARLQAEAFANQRLPAARGEAEQLKQSARAYGAQVLAQAKADTNRFQELLSAYRVNPEVMKTRLYLDTMAMVYANSEKIIIDAPHSRPIINLGGGESASKVVPIEVPVPVVPAAPSASSMPKNNPAPVTRPAVSESRSRQR